MHQRDRGNRHTWSVAGSHHLRFKFVCVSAPFAATQGGILVNSVHLSTYSLSGHDAPKAAASIQDAITGCLLLTAVPVDRQHDFASRFVNVCNNIDDEHAD